MREFSVEGVYNYSTLLLSPDEGKLYVGARENIFSLSLDDISATYLQRTVRACGDVRRKHLCVEMHFDFTLHYFCDLQLSWNTPERKRTECSFKGKDPQVCAGVSSIYKLKLQKLFVTQSYYVMCFRRTVSITSRFYFI